MGFLTLYAALLLPWLGGTFWLAFTESRFAPNNHHNRMRQAGYGFFLGYAVLFAAIMANKTFTGSTSWEGLMLFLAAFAGSGGLAVWLRRGKAISAPRPSQDSNSTMVKILTTLVLIWTAVHLAFIAIDIFTQPVYPWDAWVAWVYRAKAWYMANGINTVVRPTEWASATVASVYSIDAWNYPLLPSVIPYWAALSLGRWSETLVNLPVLFTGIALGMAVYGQCREHGISTASSLVCCYLLYSIPLFATHLSLAGYADIWMAGFTGLGFIAVMRAVLNRRTTSEDTEVQSYRMQMVVGILMLALATLVKNEGVVWLLAGLSFLVLVTFRARVPILIMVSMAVLALLGFALGANHVTIPLIGTLGIVEGRLVIPFIGNFALELHNVWRVYWDNFFAMGSWNLLWVLVFASLIVTLRAPRNQVKRVGLAFLGVFLATQLFIFGLTDQGLWADTFTAINRLPIHFVPALLFITFVILQNERVGGVSSADRELLRKPSANKKESLRASMHSRDIRSIPGRYRGQRSWPLLQLLLILIGLLAYLAIDLPDSETEPLNYPATDFNFAFGSGHADQSHMLVDTFANGYALLSSGPVSIQAGNHPVLEYEWLPPRPEQEAAFFWRQKGQPNDVIRTEITSSGTQLIDLSTEADWNGEIIEFGFLVAGEQSDTVAVGPATLRADSLVSRLQLMWQAWTTFEQRSQQSINFLQGGDHRQVVALPLIIIAWLLSGLLVMRIWLRKEPSINRKQTMLVVFCLQLLAGWMLLDIRWISNNYRQASLIQWQADDDRRLSNDLDGEIYQYVQRLKSDVLGDMPARILIIGDENAIDYYLLRAKYHLLPHSVDVISSFNKQLSPATIDYVIYFGQSGGIANARGKTRLWLDSMIEIDESPLGQVFRIDS